MDTYCITGEVSPEYKMFGLTMYIDTSSDTVRNFGVVFDLILISAIICAFHKFTNHVSIIYVISGESGVICLYQLL